MRYAAYPILALVVVGLGIPPATAQAAKEACDAAYAKAQAASKKAGELKNQWTTTETSLDAAKKAADRKDYNAAIELAKEAEALANASIAQVQRENTLWKEFELR